jgi:hypothetical protein
MKKKLEDLITEVRAHLTTLENQARQDLQVDEAAAKADIEAAIDEARAKAATVLSELADKLAGLS